MLLETRHKQEAAEAIAQVQPIVTTAFAIMEIVLTQRYHLAARIALLLEALHKQEAAEAVHQVQPVVTTAFATKEIVFTQRNHCLG